MKGLLKISQRREEPTASLKSKRKLFGEKIIQNSEEYYPQASLKKNSRQSISSILRKKRDTMIKVNAKYFSIQSFANEMYRRKHSHWVIELNNKYKEYFNIAMDFAIWYSVISSSYYLSFLNKAFTEEIIDIIIWIFFIFDFILIFFTEIRTKDNHRVMNIALIARNYIKTWFILDIASLLPFSFFGNPNIEYFLRLFRIFKMKRLSNKINIYKVSAKIGNLFYKEENKSKKRMRFAVVQSWELIKELTAILVGTYLLACAWYYYSKKITEKYNPEYNFYDYFQINTLAVNNQFIRTWYFIFSTIATVGYGDYYATNVYEMGFDIIILLSATTWFAFVMGKAVGIINQLNRASGTQDKKGQLNIWLSKIEVKAKNLPIELKKRINDFFYHYWKYDRLGSMANLADEMNGNLKFIPHPLLKALPMDLRKNLYDYLFCDFFHYFKSFFFSLSQIRYELVLFIKPAIFPKGSAILRLDEQVEEVFFKTHGEVQIKAILHDDYKEIFKTKDYFIIGDYFAFNNIRCFVDFFAVDNVLGYSIPFFVIKEFTKDNPEYLENCIKDCSPFYKNLENKLLKSCTFNNLETLDERKSFIPDDSKEESKLSIEQCVLKESRKNTLYESIATEVEQVSTEITKISKLLKKSLSQLKEKLADRITIK